MTDSHQQENWSVSPETIYMNLREEILKRLDIRYQLINYTLAAFALVMSLGLDDTVPDTVLFLYPLLSLGLVLAYVDNHNRLKLAASFLRKRHLPWEKALQTHRAHHTGILSRERLGEWSIGGIFIISQVLTVSIGMWLTRNYQTMADINLQNALFGLAVGSILVSLGMLWHNRKDFELYGDNGDS